MGNCKSAAAQGAKLQSTETMAHGKKYFTNCICIGCGVSEHMCQPALAGEVRCCCAESATHVDPRQCREPRDLCLVRAGAKAGPLVLEAKNPLIDDHELVVVVEKKLVGFSKSTTVKGKLQSNDTATKGKQFFTNCCCMGCGINKHMCQPACAGEIRCCCCESATRVDLDQCDKPKDLCMCRAGAKACPLVCDVKNPVIDNHELVVVAERRLTA